LLNLAFSVASTASTGTTAVSIDPGSSDLAGASGNLLPLSVTNGDVATKGELSTPTTMAESRSLTTALVAPSQHKAAVDTMTFLVGGQVSGPDRPDRAITVGTKNTAAPAGQAPLDAQLAMGIALNSIARPGMSGGTAVASLAVSGPSNGSNSASSTGGGLNQAAMDWLLTGGSRRKSDTASQSDAVDAVLGDPFLEW
jgi:hypothetical protein